MPRWVTAAATTSLGAVLVLGSALPVHAGGRDASGRDVSRRDAGGRDVTAAAARSYVAMGDSYSSGEGAPPFDPATTTGADACHRSRYAWPRLLSAADSTINLVAHLACSGATTADVTSRGYQSEPPQIMALKALPSPPSLITITIGGNDLGFADLVADCYLTDCASDVNGKYETRLKTVLPGLLRTTMTKVKAAAPGATTYLVGYPDILPATYTGSITARCSWLSKSDWTALNTLVRNLDSVQRQAAAAAGVRFLSITRSLAGHELCTATPWVYPVGPSGGSLRAHPIKAGQQAIAKVVGAAVSPARTAG